MTTCSMQAALAEYEGAQSDCRSDELLYMAFDKGELPLLNYLLEMEYWQDAYEEKLRAERDLQRSFAELEACKL